MLRASKNDNLIFNHLNQLVLTIRIFRGFLLLLTVFLLINFEKTNNFKVTDVVKEHVWLFKTFLTTFPVLPR